ncbi:hypothetical protein A2767_07720 [Candidatus Roizmanbacteria bacterium RIFCSPHIGHO2_01_FULL_35_10]|uniref:Uncharacterized protein n=1 Tax=Candidatus Roizmanbacteria bacterium RIFCSPLOWO2_01_FULL_35_13 TaxID=1802055 RepID=A0A1F7ICR5_9BACT|nr:MAG: hypothetical protein A2767_07720 [Candidatus Roizmanbacteria bacterium RIFCSPHIGHO2_01_FULL_35_10]OGK41154.1 MAG: hypothetical protein A3A74_02315 [Candidatus Roizmanbacteria bacterium RIFCSPLOWO2_01_FULL_35_13]
MKLLKTFSILIGLLLLVGISDLIYFYRNEPNRFGKVFLFLSLQQSKKSNLPEVLKNLNRAADLHIKQNKITYNSKLSGVENFPNVSGFNENTKAEFTTYLKKILPLAYEKNSAKLLARIYYNLGLLAHKKNYFKQADVLITIAVSLEPEAGHLYLELANIYYNNGEKAKGNKIIKKCLQFKSPKKQCQEYMSDNVSLNSFFHIGIFKDVIDTY